MKLSLNQHTTNESKTDVDIDGKPKQLVRYWNWLLTRCPIEPVELFLSCISVWWAFSLVHLYNVPVEKLPIAVGILILVMPFQLWTILTLITATTNILGVFFRVDTLRLIGMFGSVVLWIALATEYWKFYPDSPTWGAYSIVGAFSCWCFIRTALILGEPIADKMRKRRQKRQNHVVDD